MMCPWKLGQGHRNIKRTLQTIPMICPNNHLLVHKISCIHTRKGVGEWYATSNVVADRIRTKICPTSSWVRGDQKSSLCLKTNQAKCSSFKEWQKKGNKTEFCFHWVQFLTKCWSTFFTVVLKITVYPLRTYMYTIYRDFYPHFL